MEQGRGVVAIGRVQGMKAQRDKRPRRWWLQFSLRGLLVLMLLVALGLGWLMPQWRQVWLEDRVAEEIRLAGGTVFRESDFSWIIPAPEPPAIWRTWLIGANAGNPVSTAILAPDSSPEILKSLKHLRGLHALYLEGMRVRDDHIEHLLAMSELEVLDLSATDITDLGAMRLASLSNLEALSLNHTAITDRTLEAFSDTSLESLDVDDTDITMASAEQFAADHKEQFAASIFGFSYSPSPSAKHRRAAARLSRKSAIVLTYLPAQNWDSALRSRESIASGRPVTDILLDGSTWQGNSDDLEALADLASIRQIELNYTDADVELLRQLCQLRVTDGIQLSYVPFKTMADDALTPLTEFPLRRLGLDIEKLEDESLNFLAEIEGLRELMLFDTDDPIVLEREAIESLRDCGTLQALTLSGVGVSEDLITLLAECAHLEELTLRAVSMPEGTPRHLANLERLRCLKLVTTVRGPSLAEIGGFPALERLVLWGVALNDEDYDVLNGYGSLRELTFSHIEIGDDELERIASLPNLEFLEVVNLPDAVPDKERRQISPAGLEHLRQMPRLRDVYLPSGCGLDDATIEAFRREIRERGTARPLEVMSN